MYQTLWKVSKKTTHNIQQEKNTTNEVELPHEAT